MLTLRSQFYHPCSCTNLTNSTSYFTPISYLNRPTQPPSKTTPYIPRQTVVYAAKSNRTSKSLLVELKPKRQNPSKTELSQFSTNGNSRFLIVGAVSVGLVLFLMGVNDQKALAFGPEGPLMEEEFWDNVRRYALYALTVSTGAIYTITQPILELLKNPISAILILTILGGGIFIVSQVLSAMVGVSDFSYDYGY
ncbi:hypothetical protein FNV43_RR07961 [Rhamnella rubrinervis]|uniref:Uncharacterized protein ycf33 n=1 Tax=Rhamnella rubrinervis TaxID=2594499 RepID=A0A8K0MNH4_9ROSA|nr:hypothetical protein FNV43_RR07961 [Rhamnella rubrinervis]